MDPSKRKKGIGRNLLEMAVHDLFMNSGARSIKLCAGTANEKACLFIKKQGLKLRDH
ncbi:GNAT family N-acetyltransferase [Cytobacillus firmus]|uniref:GNAT family N-acetyltransferase n=1 Tax=Cytobacillus firmus TaxID=1399 RepID=UPI0022284F35|nr:GNAT family N-acetyltransferase [Cytobacillus firmus]